MSRLEDNLRRFTVNQSAEDASSTTESSDRSASSGYMSPLDLFIRDPQCSDFEWKKEVKAPFVDLLNSALAKGYEGYGMVIKAVPRHLDRHGPAYTLKLKWQGGSRYMGMKISVDLSLAVKIHSPSSSIDIDFDSQAGKVVKSLLCPYYFAVSAYRERTLDVPQTKLFEEHEKSNHELSVNDPSNCRLRVSQSCLEQSLFLHFGPDSGPSICLRVLKVLRDITQRPNGSARNGYIECFIDKSVAEFHHCTVLDFLAMLMPHDSDQDGNKWISSYALKSLVLREWKENPDAERWSGSDLCQRLLSIIETLLNCLENKDKRLRSFFYRDYNILPRVEQTQDPIIRAINRVKIIHKSLLLLRNGTTYSFEECLQNITDNAMLAWQKNKLTRFLLKALERIFSGKLRELWTESVGERNVKKEGHRTVGLPFYLKDLLSIRSLCNIYLECLINEISPEEELILTESEEARYESRRLKQAKKLFKMMACGRMKLLDHLPSFCLWTQDLAAHSREVGELLRLICENFKKDLESFMKKLKIARFLFAIASMVVAGGVEFARLRDPNCIVQEIAGKNYTACMSIAYQIPQYGLIGISEVFASVAGLEFAYKEAPKTMHSFVMGLFFFAQSAGSLIGGGLFVLCSTFGWTPNLDIISQKLEKHLSYYFFLLAGLLFVTWVILIVITMGSKLSFKQANARNTLHVLQRSLDNPQA